MRSNSKEQIRLKDHSGRKPVFIILLFVFLLYGNAIKNNFSLDDDFVTSTYDHPNKRIEKGIKGIPELFLSRYVETDQQSFSYRPLVLVTFAIEYEFFGINPYVSHFINILLYGFLCVLLYKMLLKVFQETDHRILLFIILLFAAHPVHTEVVDSLKNRDELLSFFMGICCVNFMLKAYESSPVRNIILSVIFFCMALITKETFPVLLPFILLTIYTFKKPNSKQILITGFCLLGITIFFVLVRQFLIPEESQVRTFVFTENPLFYDHSLASRIPASLFILLFYLKLMVFPFPLSAYYGYNTVPIAGWAEPMVWISLLLHLAMLFFGIRYYKRYKILSYGLLAYLLAILPYSNLLRPGVGIVAERYSLAASFGFSIFLPILILFIFNRGMKSITPFKITKQSVLFASVLIVFFSFRTFSRNNDWKDIKTLFKRDLEYYPNSYNLHYIYANAISREIPKQTNLDVKNDLRSEALTHYSEVARIVESGLAKAPSDYISRNNLGTIYVNYLNQPKRAVPLFEEAIRLNPAYAEAYYNLGFCYEKLNQSDSAAANYEAAIKLNDHYIDAYKRLDAIYQDKHLFSEAIAAGEKAIKSFPANAELYINVGNAQLSNKDTVNGIINFEKAVNAEPRNVNLKQQIFSFFQSIGYNPASGKWRNTQIK
ncbi:MAG: tetratricopeptide repeat protein [Bacteroidota bacterium]|jgi:tetratricopeptide (TPR) repeat protein|nr:tetratricopeptide repeat protein [Bacteroidota bacterium]